MHCQVWYKLRIWKIEYTSVHLVKITYQNISYLMKTLKSWHFRISFHMVKEGIFQNKNTKLPTGGSRLSRTVVQPDSRLARIFVAKFLCIIKTYYNNWISRIMLKLDRFSCSQKIWLKQDPPVFESTSNSVC